MKIGERGQVTIPKKLRKRFGFGRDTEVEFRAFKGALILRKKPKSLKLDKWKGHARKSFDELGFRSVDEFIEDARGR